MNRLTIFVRQLFNSLSNPIIVKELRSRMRGPRAFITLTGVLIIMGLVSYAIYQLVIITSTWSNTPLSPQIGQTLFSVLVVLEMIMICLITPAVTAGSISSEHEKQTYEMLLTTPLNPTRILWGKLVSALSYIFLLVFAAIPIGSLVFIYGGVALRDMIKALIVLLSTAIMLGTVGIFMSACSKRSGRATIISYLIVIGLLGFPTFFYAIIGVIRQAEPPRWILVPSPINAIFSAIAPSTSLGNAAAGMFGGFSMLLGGNLGTVIRQDSIPRPLYHYTLPLYGLITLGLYFLATRLIRPTRRWRFKVKETSISLTIFIIFLGAVTMAFWRSTNRYENVSIFTVPTPFPQMPVEARAIAIEEPPSQKIQTQEQIIEIYAGLIREAYDQGFLLDEQVIQIPHHAFAELTNPDINETNTTILTEDTQVGIVKFVEDLPIKIDWLDDFDAVSFGDGSSVTLLFGNIEHYAPDLVQVPISLYIPENPTSQNITFQLVYENGLWNVHILE